MLISTLRAHQCISTIIAAGALVLGCTQEPAPRNHARANSATPGAGGAPSGVGDTVGGGSVPGAGGATPGTGGALVPVGCDVPVPPRAPLRRLTRFEYSNTARDLFNDLTAPGNLLPGEQSGNGFGNDADSQSVSSLLAQQYIAVAEDVAQRATAATQIAHLAPCAADLVATPSAATELECVRSLAQSFAPRIYRRQLLQAEVDDLVILFQAVRSGGEDFARSLAAVLEGLLLSPDFLYRPEFGVAVSGRPDLLRPTGNEMATRLAYTYWASTPDPDLIAAAARGELDTKEGVLTHATRMLNDPRSDVSLRYFFDNQLPISGLAGLTRDPVAYPTFTPRIGELLREETLTFLRHVIFEGDGRFESIFTAPYTLVNAELAAYYGYTPVTGEAFQKVPLDGVRRLGLLTQGGVLAGTVHSNHTNPVKRGAFLMKELLCQPIPPPSAAVAASIKPPDPYQGATARDRFRAHSQDPGCAGCHSLMDPIGLAQENIDAVGLWRDTENGVAIDASGQVPILGAPFNGPVELAQRVAATPEVKACFASHFMNYAYGRTLGAADQCTQASVQNTFVQSNYDIKSMLTALSQSDAFLYLSAVKE
ncbi:MAG: DUF1592 domain-containing protein [Polyangiaceae bacterium]|nr:DUF1592 domain-containing protein [Polyangiaceae bacterium]